jgi:CMP-N,N'-diacetyllegionaminic acid synthase
MFNDKTFLAIIPARGGSKRLPHKNLLMLAGKLLYR